MLSISKKKDDGSALILCLLVATICSSIVILTIHMAITESKQGKLAIDRSKAYAAARGGIVYSINLIKTENKSKGGYFPLLLELGEANVTVKAYSERGRIDLNYGSLDYLTKILSELELNEEKASFIIQRLKDRRRKLHKFKSVAEFQLESRLDGPSFKKISRYITVWAGPGAFDLGSASPELALTLGLQPGSSFPKLDSVFTLEANIELNNGFLYRLTQTFRIEDYEKKDAARLLRSDEYWSYGPIQNRNSNW